MPVHAPPHALEDDLLRLREENARLRVAAEMLGTLAERLNVALREERRRHPIRACAVTCRARHRDPRLA